MIIGNGIYIGNSSGGGEAYSEEAQAVFANMNSQPPTALKSAMAAFIDSQVTSGNWDKIIDYVRLDLDTEANSLSAWKGVVTPQLVNASWSIYSDVVTGGTGSYIKSGFIPNNIAAWSLNDCGFGVGLRADNTGIAAKALFGSFEAANNTGQLIVNRTSGGAIQYRANTSSASSTSVITDFSSHKFYAVDKQATTSIRLLEDETTIDTNTVVNGAKGTIEVYIGARNNDGTADNFMAGHYRYYILYNAVGFDVADFITNVQIFNNTIDGLIDFIPLVYQIGQSNEDGRAEINRASALSSYSTTLSSTRTWYKSVYDTNNNGNFRGLILGTNNINPDIESSYNLFGQELSLSQLIWQTQKLPLFWIKSARGGTSLASDAGGQDWDPNNTGECYDISVDAYLLPAIAKLNILYPGKTIKILIAWQQGETDVDPANYLTNLTAFITSLRAEDALLATAPLFITKLHYSLDSDEDTVNAAIDSYASTDNTYVFDVASQVTYPRKVDLPLSVRTDYPATLADDNHNSYEFQIKKGELYYAKLIEIEFF